MVEVSDDFVQWLRNSIRYHIYLLMIVGSLYVGIQFWRRLRGGE